MFTQKYIWRNADKYGFTGLLPVGQLDADPTLTPAHDFFDHEGLPRENDCYSNEFLAIGTSVALRVVHDPMVDSRLPLIADYIKDVIQKMCSNFERYVGVESMKHTTKTRPIKDSNYGDYPEELLKAALALAVSGVTSEADAWTKNNLRRILTPQGLDSILSYLRMGYRRGLARFGKYDVKELGTYLFHKLDHTVTDYFKEQLMTDGQTVTLFVIPKKCEVRIHVDGKLRLVA